MFKTHIINSLAHSIFEILLSFYGLFSEKIAKGVKGRKNSFEKLKASLSNKDKIIHIHCSSYGEYLMTEALTVNLKKSFIDHSFSYHLFPHQAMKMQIEVYLIVLYIYLLKQIKT